MTQSIKDEFESIKDEFEETVLCQSWSSDPFTSTVATEAVEYVTRHLPRFQELKKSIGLSYMSADCFDFSDDDFEELTLSLLQTVLVWMDKHDSFTRAANSLAAARKEGEQAAENKAITECPYPEHQMELAAAWLQGFNDSLRHSTPSDDVEDEDEDEDED